MKIACNHCGNMYDDTLTSCPSCGAENKTVRMSDKAPETIEDLKQWYLERGLPPYETTRFFIGIDYKQPKAFGIFQEDAMFIVYKNKADGTRSIRYAGSDEAYAVNELWMRLKEEILNQKGLNKDSETSIPIKDRVSKKTSRADSRSNVFITIASALLLLQGACWGLNGYFTISGKCYEWVDILFKAHNILFLMFIAVLPVLFVFACIKIVSQTKDDSYMNKDVESGGIDGIIKIAGVVVLIAISVLIAIFVIKSDKKTVDMRNEAVAQSKPKADKGHDTPKGYYKYDNKFYYHMYDGETGWYAYDDSNDSWSFESLENVPDSLKSSVGAEFFYYTPDWDSETQMTDFEDTQLYINHSSREDDVQKNIQAKEKEREKEKEKQSISSGKHSSNNDSNYDWDSNDSWDSGGTDWDSDW